jgi:hypothetical protein
MAATKKPRVTFAVLADRFNVYPNQKIDAIGIFNKFLVWGTPATRDFSLILGIDHLRKGETVFEAHLQNPEKKRRSLRSSFAALQLRRVQRKLRQPSR